MTFTEVLDELRALARGAKHAETGLWVSHQLRQRIAAGELAPGTKLAEEALCEALGVSRNTLREAFTALHAEHIITRIPNRGVFVAHPNGDDIREIYRVRRYLEPAALMWSPSGSTVELEAIVAQARQARDDGDIAGMAGANQDFHRVVVARAGSERLDALMAQVLAEMRLVFHAMAADPVFHEPYVEDNGRIIELLAAGRPADAAAFLADYLERAEAQLLAAVEGVLR
jgi:DNA-binding GntR family transcriptional regulator